MMNTVSAVNGEYQLFSVEQVRQDSQICQENQRDFHRGRSKITMEKLCRKKWQSVKVGQTLYYMELTL